MGVDRIGEVGDWGSERQTAGVYGCKVISSISGKNFEILLENSMIYKYRKARITND